MIFILFRFVLKKSDQKIKQSRKHTNMAKEWIENLVLFYQRMDWINPVNHASLKSKKKYIYIKNDLPIEKWEEKDKIDNTNPKI